MFLLPGYTGGNLDSGNENVKLYGLSYIWNSFLRLFLRSMIVVLSSLDTRSEFCNYFYTGGNKSIVSQIKYFNVVRLFLM